MALRYSPGPDDTMAPSGSTGHSDWQDIVLGYHHGPGLNVTLVPGGSPDAWQVIQWYQEPQTATQILAAVGLPLKHAS